MSSTTNKAAWLNSKGSRPLEIKEAPMPTPGRDELVLRTRATAFNPVDAAQQAIGLLVPHYPWVLGLDMAGEVHSVGDGEFSSRFRVGDRVVAMAGGARVGDDAASDSETDTGSASSGSARGGAHQFYTVVKADLVAIIPDSTSFAQASVLPLATATAAVALFHPNNLALELPTVPARQSDQGSGKNGGSIQVVVVWGASSSVGSCGIQMLRAAGYEVAAVAGGSNKSYCEDLGAKWFFDRSDPNIVDDIAATLKKEERVEVVGVFAAIFDEGVTRTCIEIAQRTMDESSPKGKRVGTVYPPGLPFPEDLPKDVKVTECDSGLLLTKGELAPDIFGKFIPAALADGSLRCKPDPKIVGKGLEACQEALDLIAKSVSATKLVVEIA